MTTLCVFADSPHAGDPACRCSFCGQAIAEDVAPFRIWTDDEPRNGRASPPAAPTLPRACLGHVTIDMVDAALQSAWTTT